MVHWVGTMVRVREYGAPSGHYGQVVQVAAMVRVRLCGELGGHKGKGVQGTGWT